MVRATLSSALSLLPVFPRPGSTVRNGDKISQRKEHTANCRSQARARSEFGFGVSGFRAASTRVCATRVMLAHSDAGTQVDRSTMYVCVKAMFNTKPPFAAYTHSSTMPGHGRTVGLPFRGFEIGFEKLGRRGYDSTQATIHHATVYEAKGGLVLNAVHA
eukprot:268445-Rhodomonas_salina.1